MNEASKATEELLAELHGELARSFKRSLEKAREKGESIPATLAAQIIRFLKDNGINSPGKEDPNLRDLAAELPEFDEQDATIRLQR